MKAPRLTETEFFSFSLKNNVLNRVSGRRQLIIHQKSGLLYSFRKLVMKKMSHLLPSLMLVAVNIATAAEEAESNGNNTVEENGFYASAGLGRVEPDFSDATFRNGNGAPVAGNTLRQEFDRAPMLRLTGGYNWRQWALEASYEHTLKEGDFAIGNARGSFDYGNLTVAGVYRGSGRLYPLIKVGLSNPDIDTNSASTRLRLGKTAFAGVGFGYRMTPKLGVEFDFTRSSDDTAAFMLSLRRHF
jgi:hypothetical protein